MTSATVQATTEPAVLARDLSGADVSVDARYLKRPGVGISRYIMGVIEQLERENAQLTLLTDADNHVPELEERYPGMKVMSLPRASGIVWEQWNLPRYLRRSRHDAHIAGANFGLPLAPTRTRKILVVHDLIPLRMPRTYMAPRPAWSVKYVLSQYASLKAADTLIAVSHATATDIEKLARRDDAEVRYPKWQVPIPHPLPDLPADWPEHYIAFNGGLDPRKNVDRLIEGFAEYRRRGGKHHLVLMGEGYEPLLPLIARLGIAPFTHLPGWVDEGIKYAAVRDAGAVAYPSELEGFGLPVCEAIRLGTPIITGRGGSLHEVGGDIPVYVEVQDPASIADGIERALEPDTRKRVAEHGMDQLDRLFTPETLEQDPMLQAILR